MTQPPLVADTGGLLRALARSPRGPAAWPDFEWALVRARRVIVPSTILPEIDYFLRDDRSAMRRLVAQIFDPSTTYEYLEVTPELIVRAFHLDAKFASLHLGLVDATVVAVAERLRVYRVLTSDRRDFSAVRVGERFSRALTLVP